MGKTDFFFWLGNSLWQQLSAPKFTMIEANVSKNSVIFDMYIKTCI